MMIKQNFSLRKKSLLFKRMRRVEDSSFPLHVKSVRLSARIIAVTTGDFTKICLEDPNEFDIGQQYRALCMKTSGRCNVAGENNRHTNVLFERMLSGW
jgi:hypothetical protein